MVHQLFRTNYVLNLDEMHVKKTVLSAILACFVSPFSYSQDPVRVLPIFDKIVFYDGYASPTAEELPPGIVKLSNSLYAKKLADSERQAILSTMEVEVTIGARCDNYDRIGGVFLSLVPKGETLTDQNKQTIEIGRFITPFMNKNRQPLEVPYTFDLTHLVPLFKDAAYETYDFWVEFNVFGVPYAANVEVSGCAGRTDVFEGSLAIKTQDNGSVLNTFYLEPLASRASFNNYNATDVEGTTTKLYQFTLEEDINEAYFHLITSNHGANNGGEEYIRRTHQVYLDGALIETYKPGGKSCEPFRVFNTQANGIYGQRPRTEADWASWNNWCPGDVIPNRVIRLIDLTRGTHEFKITVPDARFIDKQGDFPLSLFFYATGVDGVLSTDSFEQVSYNVYPNPAQELVYIRSEVAVESLVLYDMKGTVLLTAEQVNQLDIGHLSSGKYVLKLVFENGMTTTENIVKK